MTAHARGRRRAGAVLGLAVAAPVCAEFVQGYLPITGDPLGLLAALLILSPLYGGAALLIRETAVRSGRGWPGILLLGTSFGVLQAGIIDLSLFLGPQTGVPAFDNAGTATSVVAGVSVYAATTWICGHVMMTIGTPLALFDWAAPGLRGRPWLGPFGIGVTAILFAIAAVLIHFDQRGTASVPGWDLAGAGAMAALLAALAFTPLGRPLRRAPSRTAPPASWLLAGAFLGKLTLDLLPATWLGVAIAWALLTAGVAIIVYVARSPAWSARHSAALAAGALMAWTLVGFLAPNLPDVEPLHRYVHNAAFAIAACAVAVAVLRSPTSGSSETDPD
jgi:hypothetical protein